MYLQTWHIWGILCDLHIPCHLDDFSNTFSQWRASYINVNIEEYWLRQYKLFPLRIKTCICKHCTFGEFYVICTFLVILMIFAIHFHNGVPRLLMFTFNTVGSGSRIG